MIRAKARLPVMELAILRRNVITKVEQMQDRVHRSFCFSVLRDIN